MEWHPITIVRKPFETVVTAYLYGLPYRIVYTPPTRQSELVVKVDSSTSGYVLNNIRMYKYKLTDGEIKELERLR